MSDDNVVQLRLVEAGNVPPQAPLTDALQMCEQGELLDVVVIGRMTNGDMYFASSNRDLNKVSVELMMVTSEIMDMAEEQNVIGSSKRES